MTPERWAQIEELFHRAFECEPNERAGLLNEACRNDPELRREVEALLASAGNAGEHLHAAVREQLETVGFPLAGETISHYRILDGLAGGGMGVVYKAEDTRLGRLVAMKFLTPPAPRSSQGQLERAPQHDPQALERFKREARAASALSHPNICVVYDVGEYEGQPFIVMELLEGQTLNERIVGARGARPAAGGEPVARQLGEGERRSPLPLDTLLDLAIQIADALDAAHSRGIIHRDIKPANILVTRQGQAKILDFGLAKLASLVRAPGDSSVRLHRHDDEGAQAATEKTVPLAASDLSISLTGVAMGTPGYMSPEQVRGEKLDARTDLFSFGSVLYEMATGQRPFTGDTGPVLQNAILKQIPKPVRELNPKLPRKLERIIDKALEKDRATRYQTAAELRADLEAVKQKMQPGRSVARRRELAAGVVVVLLIASAAFWFAKRQSPSKNPPPELKLRQLTTNSSENAVGTGTISPDGRYLAYTDRKGMHIKLIESGETHTIPQPEELKSNWVDWEIGPWFPDGKRFLANAHPPGLDATEWTSQGSSIWIVSELGGPPHKLRDEATADSISRDGSTISFDTNKGRLGDREIWLMGSSGEQPRKLYDTGENSSIGGLNWSPDGQRALYERIDEPGPNLVSRDLKGASPVAILSPPEAKRLNEYLWLPDGRVIYALREPDPNADTCNYWQIRIDPRSGEPVEKPRRITNWAGLCVAATSVTSDGKRLAFLEWRRHTSVYVADLQAGGPRITTPTRLTLDDAWNNPLGWTADGKAVLFFSSRNGAPAVFQQSLGQDTAQPLITVNEDEDLVGSACLSPEGSWVFYMVRPKEGDLLAPSKLMRVPITGGSPLALAKLMRVPITGGSPQLVLTANIEGGPRCARSPATLCAIAERSADRKQLVFAAFDPVKGRGRELAELKTDATADYQWDLSPDGARITFLKNRGGRIQILSLNGRAPQEITVKGWNSLTNAVWTADGKGLFVSSLKEEGSVLMGVDLQGNGRILWENSGGVGTYGVPSPVGRHLAMIGWTLDSNIWMMENF
jgi:serine/threonine protein kinase